MSNGFQSNRITIFREQYDAISKLSISIQGKVYKALMDYNFAGTMPKLDATAQLAFDLIKAGLDVSLSKQRAGQIGGKKSTNKPLLAESRQEPTEAIEGEDNVDLVESNQGFCSIESEEDNPKEPLKSYEEIMDDCCVESSLRFYLWEFIKHCQANGHILINSKLLDIIQRLDMAYGDSTGEKIRCLRKAIAGGYFDIKEK